jgi:hypothetical protein
MPDNGTKDINVAAVILQQAKAFQQQLRWMDCHAAARRAKQEYPSSHEAYLL